MGYIIGEFPSEKGKKEKVGDTGHRNARYESTIERDFFYELEFDPTVIWWLDHPSPIEWPFEDGSVHSYFPDCDVQRTFQREIVECKPEELRGDPHTLQQITIGEGWTKANDRVFILVTDQQLRQGHRLEGIKFLWRYRHVELSPGLVSKTLAYL